VPIVLHIGKYATQNYKLYKFKHYVYALFGELVYHTGKLHSLRPFYYGLAADRQEYCFTFFFRTGGGPPGVLFYKSFFFFFFKFKFIFEPKNLFFQIRTQNLWGVHALSFSKLSLVS